AVAAAVSIAIAGGTVEAVIAGAQRCLPDGSWIAASMQTAMDICDRLPDIEMAYEALHTKLWTPEHATAPEAIPQAFAIFRLCGGNPRRSLLWSAILVVIQIPSVQWCALWRGHCMALKPSPQRGLLDFAHLQVPAWSLRLRKI
ncbi:MAG: hypothetical protein QHH01_01605, partial [Spirochaetales bacterium]|nr:hypothetical protein [Spirochaetales bacterium]